MRAGSTNLTAYKYSIATLVITAILGAIIIIAFPSGGTVSSIFFILMNLTPMIAAFIFSKIENEVNGLLDFLKKNFLQKETYIPYAMVAFAIVMYYGISVVLGNVSFTGASVTTLLLYFPWTFLQGGLEEVGWRWYLQTHLNIKNNYILKMLAISVIWFLWHIPIYMIPWITSASSNYFIFYLMILGNTFMFGAIREVSKGSLPCVLAHMLIDSLAVVMLVQSDFAKIMIQIVIETMVSTVFVFAYKAMRKRKMDL